MVIEGAGKPLRPRANAETIVQAAEHLFRRQGYHKTTVADIAKGLGMSSANVYRFFHSKEELRRAVFSRILDASHSIALRASELPIDAASRIRKYVKAQHVMTIEVIADHRTLHELILLSLNRDRDLVDRHIARISDVLTTVIADGIDRGEFARQDARRISRIFIMATATTWHPILLANCREGRKDDRLDELLDFTLNALKRPLSLTVMKTIV